MSKFKYVWLTWKCLKCGRTHKDEICGRMCCNGLVHTFEWECDKCGKTNLVHISSWVERKIL